MLGELAPCTPSPGKSPPITWGPDANRGDIEALIYTGVQFHKALQGMPGNPQIVAAAEGIQPQMVRSMRALLEASSGRSPARAAHTTIADAIAMENAERGDANASGHAESASRTIYQWRRDF